MTSLVRICLLCLFVVSVTTCDEFPEDIGGPEPGPIQVTIETLDWPDVIRAGEDVTLAVAVRDGQGRALVDPPLQWNLNNADLGSLAPGQRTTEQVLSSTSLEWVSITVSVNDERFAAASVTDSVRVMIAGLRFTTPSQDTTLASLEEPLQIGVEATDANGGGLPTGAVTWAYSDHGALAVEGQAATTLDVRSVADGVDTVRAELAGACAGGVCEAEVEVRVLQQVASVTVVPQDTFVEEEETVQLTAEAADALGHPMAPGFDWSTDNAAAATVDGTGLVTGVVEGFATITATAAGTDVSGTAAVEVIRGTGVVDGRVYRDDDASGGFTAGDEPLEGATVTLVEGTSLAGDTVAIRTTDSGGLYEFAIVPEGDYVVAVDPLPGTTLTDPVQAATVFEDGTTTVDFTFTGAPVTTVAAVRNEPLDEPVAAEGIVTSATDGSGGFGADLFYLQDGTAGIAIFMPGANFPGGYPALSTGDSVRVVGVRTVSGTGYESVDATEVTSLGAGTVPDPVVISGSQLAGGNHQGELAVVRDVVVDSLTGGANEFVWVHDPDDGDAVFSIHVHGGTGLDPVAEFEVGRAYTVTGIVTVANPFVLQPRQASDIAFGLLPSVSIADARAAATGEFVGVAGVVTAGTDVFNAAGQVFYVQDASGGIRGSFLGGGDAFPDGFPTLLEGDSVRISGERGAAGVEAALIVDAVRVVGTGTVPGPRDVTATDINGGLFPGELGEVTDMLVDSIVANAGGEEVGVSDARVGGEDLQVFLDSDAGVTGTLTAGRHYRIRGIISLFDGVRQIKPRRTSDIVEVILPIAISDARLAGIGEEIAVGGVVNAASGTFGSDVVFIQDGSAGIQLFFPAADFPTPPSLILGDSVRAAGFRSDANGVARLDVYDLSVRGVLGLDTIVATPGDIAAGTYQGELVRIEDVVANFVIPGANTYTVEGPLGASSWMDLEPAGIPFGPVGVGGEYDVVGIPGMDDTTRELWPRSSGDVTQLTPPYNLWVRWVNIPVPDADSVEFAYNDGGGSISVFRDGGRGHRYASIDVVQNASISWAFGAYLSGDPSLGYRSAVYSDVLDDSINATVVACMVAACASGSGDAATGWQRNGAQATHEMFGIFPSREAAGTNDDIANADSLDLIFRDAVGGLEIYAHSGYLDPNGGDPSDYYTFEALAGDTLIIEVFADRFGADSEGSVDPYLYLYDAGGTQLAADDDSGSGLDSRIVFEVPSDGFYTVRMTHFSGNTSAGVYTLGISLDYETGSAGAGARPELR